MKALSILQPWAWLIVNGNKDIENRNWHTRFRGRFLVHEKCSVIEAETARYVLDLIRRDAEDVSSAPADVEALADGERFAFLVSRWHNCNGATRPSTPDDDAILNSLITGDMPAIRLVIDNVRRLSGAQPAACDTRTFYVSARDCMFRDDWKATTPIIYSSLEYAPTDEKLIQLTVSGVVQQAAKDGA